MWKDSTNLPQEISMISGSPYLGKLATRTSERNVPWEQQLPCQLIQEWLLRDQTSLSNEIGFPFTSNEADRIEGELSACKITYWNACSHRNCIIQKKTICLVEMEQHLVFISSIYGTQACKIKCDIARKILAPPPYTPQCLFNETTKQVKWTNLTNYTAN